MKVYPTHRTANYPNWLYESTKGCASSAELVDEGNTLINAHACYPFPIPENGHQAIWNHLTQYQSLYRFDRSNTVAPDKHGRYVTATIKRHLYVPYYNRKLTEARHLIEVMIIPTAPARVAGNVILRNETINPIDTPGQAWIYLAGQRRVRRAPILQFDTPLPDGLRTIDSIILFNGSLERYDWKLLGKKEMYIPYNSYQLSEKGVTKEEVVRPGHLNPEYLRYEKHRVWVVEATVKKAKNICTHA